MNTCKRVLSGIFCLMIVLVITASASITNAVRDPTLTIYYDGEAIMCEDGTLRSEIDASGNTTASYRNQVLSLTYDGEVYIPLYTVSRMLGSEVRYDDAARVVRLTTHAVDKYAIQELARPENGEVRRVVFPENNMTTTVAVDIIRNVPYIARDITEDASVAVDMSNTVTLLLYDDVPYVSVGAICACVGLHWEHNSYLNGIDIMTYSFKDALDSYINTDDELVECVYSEARGLRDYIYTNIFKESSSVDYRFTLRKMSDESCYCVVNRDMYNLHKSRVADNDVKLREIVQNLDLDGKTPRDKIEVILNWIWISYAYDSSVGSSRTGRTVYSLLNEGNKVVCEGYARMFYLLCREAGIQCQYLIGHTNMSKEGPILHAWDRVFLDGQWLYVDPTVGATAPSLRSKIILVPEQEMAEYHGEGSFKIAY